MIATVGRRFGGEQEGYALVVAIVLLSIMMVLLVVGLEAGSNALRHATLGIEWSKTLTIAEAGVNDAVTRLGQSRTATNPCAIGTSTTCTASGGEYQVSWTTSSSGGMTVTSIGYYPTKASPRFTRKIQETYEVVPSFKYALFSQNALTIKNNVVIAGDVYSQGNVTVGSGATVCGSVISSTGSIDLQNNSQVVKSYAPNGCIGKTGQVWSGGSGGIVGANGVVIAGDAKASAPSSVTCNINSPDYAINAPGTTVSGAATACGNITGVSGATSTNKGTASSQSSVMTLPSFTFDPANYTSLTCYPSGGTCGANDSSTAVSDFNAYVQAHKTTLSGTFAVWQTAPTQSTKISLDVGTTSLSLAGDFTLITNGPVDFGNTASITTSATSAEMVIVSQYTPPSSSSCDVNGGECSIYGQNAVEFGRGNVTDPDDGVVGLLYTSGTMAFKNQGTPGEGALYATSMDLKNGFDIVYNPRIEKVLGFGMTLERNLWQELTV